MGVRFPSPALSPPLPAVEVVTAPAGLAGARGGPAVVDPRLLAPELLPRGQARRVERGADGAAGLALVRAVGEAAAGGERLDVLELRAVPHARLPQAGRVDQERAVRQR